jgi:hypothetical protein
MKWYIVITCICLCACSSEAPVFDGVEVDVQEFDEYVDGYARIGRVVLSIENTSVVPIYSAMVSLRLETSGGRYYTTVHDDRGVPPKTRIYVTVEFTYLSAEERADPTGVAITDTYFH